MNNSFCSLGLMSGTSADGIDASIIQSNGDTQYKVILDKYFEYNQNIYKGIHNLKDQINNINDLKSLTKEIKLLEKEITLFHGTVVNEIIKDQDISIDLVGFHGQTIFHNAKEKISKQLGDGKLLSKITKKTIVSNFRQNDIKNHGQGAPLTPIFHKLLKEKFKIKDVTFVNIGGIVNTTTLLDNENMSGTDIGPGMCLIDRWIRKKTKKKYDYNGMIAKLGKVNKKVLDQLLENFYEKQNSLDKGPTQSFDTQNFNFSLVQDLSLNDGAATLTEFTAQIIISALRSSNHYKQEIILCGGGRKNDFLFKKIKENNTFIKLIDEYGVDGDFVESQAFAYIAIRSYLKLPISFPETTGVKEPCLGGEIFIN